MRFLVLALVVVVAAARPAGGAQTDNPTLADVLESGKQWLEENIDPAALEQLGQLDAEQLKQLCLDLQQQFQRDNVVDLAALKQNAEAILPYLEQCDDTKPYAAWLRSRLDYLATADYLRQTIRAPREPSLVGTNPAPDLQRQTWRQLLGDRPLPRAALAYVPQLKPIFAAQRVPPVFVWLAEVESSFNPVARSPVGAAGLFQLMPATAQAQGLSLRPADERLSAPKSARATARYLRYLYSQFKDWRLALAAYNAGEGRVRRLLARRQAGTFDEISVYLPAETQMYVPKVEATIFRREGVMLADLPGPPSKLD